MDINVIGSSSKGNAYLISSGGRSLLLEAGINLKGLDLSKVDGCLITHEHGDHSNFGKNIINKTGLDIYMSAGTQSKLNYPKHRVKIIEALKTFKIGNWLIKPFPTEHDASEPLGFMIQSPEGERLLFATDTYFIRYRFPGITHFMIECNYSLDILNNNVNNGRVGFYLKKRVMRSHFELENVKAFLLSNDLSQTKEIWLLHLSNMNADKERFKKEVEAATGVPVYFE